MTFALKVSFALRRESLRFLAVDEIHNVTGRIHPVVPAVLLECLIIGTYQVFGERPGQFFPQLTAHDQDWFSLTFAASMVSRSDGLTLKCPRTDGFR